MALSSSPSIVHLLYLLQERKFTRGETIIAQGAPLTQLLYLQKGQLDLSCARYQRTHQIITLCVTLLLFRPQTNSWGCIN
jgi:hypothetical protein